METSEVKVESGIGNVATVWNGKVASMAGGLARVRREKKALKLAHSKAPSRRSGRRVGQERPDPET